MEAQTSRRNLLSGALILDLHQALSQLPHMATGGSRWVPLCELPLTEESYFTPNHATFLGIEGWSLEGRKAWTFISIWNYTVWRTFVVLDIPVDLTSAFLCSYHLAVQLLPPSSPASFTPLPILIPRILPPVLSACPRVCFLRKLPCHTFLYYP